MVQSQEIGAAVALKQFGYKVPIKSPGTVIADVNPKGPSAGKLRANDAIAAVDGQPTPSLPALRRQITKHRPGQSVALTVRRDGAVRTVDVKTAPDPQDKKRSIIGVLTSCALQTPTEDLASRAGAHRPRPGRRAVRWARLRPRRRREARARRRPRPPGGGDRGDVPRRLGAPRRRTQAEDDRRQARGSGRLSRSRWGKRTGSAPLCRKHARHPCADLSTGVARAGNAEVKASEMSKFRQFDPAGICSVFVRACS